MRAVAAVVSIVLLGVISYVLTEPVQQCAGGLMFVADDEDLCRYHWCIGAASGPVEMRCAPGARVPTWFVSAPSDYEIPCIIDHSTDVSCMRCNYQPDPSLVIDRDDCLTNSCPADCLCQDLWQQHYCICPGADVPIAVGGTVDTFFCDPNPCMNGASCHSQYNDYWCECPNGYTGKNCEVPMCEPNPCQNEGVCTIDNLNYHCECQGCYGGSCCQDVLQGCNPIAPPGRVTPPKITTTPYTPPPVTTTPYKPPVTTTTYKPPVTTTPYKPPVTTTPYVPPYTTHPTAVTQPAQKTTAAPYSWGNPKLLPSP